MNILEIIKPGRENAVTRQELASRMGMSDRSVRNAIEDARREGALIVNLGTGEGYYLSDRIEDLRHQYNMNHHRAMSILAQQRHLRRRMKELEEADNGQTVLDI